MKRIILRPLAYIFALFTLLILVTQNSGCSPADMSVPLQYEEVSQLEKVDLNTKAPPLGSGEHRYYFTSSGKYFTIDRGTSVSVTVKTDVNSSVKIGYYKVGESDVTTYTSASRKTNHSTTITIPADGQYSIWIYNNGSDAFTVTGGSMEG